MEIRFSSHLSLYNQLRSVMKPTFTLIIMMSALIGVTKGQEKKPRTKQPGLLKDSGYAPQLMPKAVNPLVLNMPIDTARNGNVKIPNSYRKGGLEPVPMPTHQLKLMMLKRRQDSSDTNSIQPVPMPNKRVYPVKPKK
jgi:hypothetical protein